MNIILLISQPNMCSACLDQDDLVLSVVFVLWDTGTRWDLLREKQEMFGAIGLRADLDDELASRRGHPLAGAASANFAFVLLQNDWRNATLRSGVLNRCALDTQHNRDG
jgi:hypothetical protein